jgi:putative endonuclease
MGHGPWPERTAGLDYNRPVHFVYIVRYADGTLYTGYAKDPRAREEKHNRGRGAKYTAGRRPVRLVYQEPFRSAGKALAREYAIKQLTRAQKHALIAAGTERAPLARGTRRVSSRASKSATRRRRPTPTSGN